MRNRAKCKLCHDVIESFHSTDLMLCKCGEIEVDGGDALRCAAKNWSNFLRVDDKDNEIVVKVKDSNVKEVYMDKPIGKKELLDQLDDMIKNIEALPSNAMTTPINHYDLCALLLLLSGIFKAKE